MSYGSRCEKMKLYYCHKCKRLCGFDSPLGAPIEIGDKMFCPHCILELDVVREGDRFDLLPREWFDFSVCPDCGRKQQKPKREGDECENPDCESYIARSAWGVHWWNINWE